MRELFRRWIRMTLILPLSWLAEIPYLAIRPLWTVRSVHVGATPLGSARSLCLFAHFDPKGRVSAYILRYLTELKAQGFEIVFVTTSRRLSEESLAALTPLCALAIQRRNFGLDFGSWRTALAVVGERAYGYERLLLANDSVFGPLYPLAGIFAKMDFVQADVWGITESWDPQYHLQSYFLLFGKKALAAPAFRKFWDGFIFFRSKYKIIKYSEVGMSEKLILAGLRLRAFCDYDEVYDRVAARGDAYQFHERMRLYLFNPSIYFWDSLIADSHCPFLKTELLKKNGVGLKNVGQWREVIKRSCDYPTELIEQHLS